MIKTVLLHRADNSYYFYIPKDLIDDLGWENVETIQLEVIDDFVKKETISKTDYLKYQPYLKVIESHG